jgi:hypothetical protein
MKLQQGQVWQQNDQLLRIVHLERLEVEYKVVPRLNTREGVHHHVSKKDFCRLIKGATLIAPKKSESPVKTSKPAPPAKK